MIRGALIVSLRCVRHCDAVFLFQYPPINHGSPDQRAALKRSIAQVREYQIHILPQSPQPVVRDGARHPYPIRQYQRLFQVRQARRRTIESMNEFRLPREVDVRIEMK